MPPWHDTVENGESGARGMRVTHAPCDEVGTPCVSSFSILLQSMAAWNIEQSDSDTPVPVESNAADGA